MNHKIFFKTFGCRTNLFDTQIMIANLKDYELVLSEQDANIIVINSCTVTNGADSGVRNYINQIKTKYPDIKIFFTGCGVNTQGKKLFNDKKINGLFGHSEKEKINFLVTKDNFEEIGDLNHIDKTIVSDFVGKTKAFIKIQEGCDFDCSYCIIPSVRGNSRSVQESTILNQIELLANNGFSEFTLTGTNMGSYGINLNTNISKLLKKISLIKNVVTTVGSVKDFLN
jgi:tRNA A37 methylthiotransferase MiaB